MESMATPRPCTVTLDVLEHTSRTLALTFVYRCAKLQIYTQILAQIIDVYQSATNQFPLSTGSSILANVWHIVLTILTLSQILNNKPAYTTVRLGFTKMIFPTQQTSDVSKNVYHQIGAITARVMAFV